MPTNWSTPILSSLPEKGYQDNAATVALTSWIDTNLAAKATQLQEFYKELDPQTAKAESLDYLAYLVGLSGVYWDTQWSAPVKRTLIQNAHPILWSRRGTLEVLSFVLNTHGIEHQLWNEGDLTLGFRLGSAFSTSKLRFFLRLPIRYNRQGLEFREAERTLRNYAPAITEHKAVYKGFYLGFSRLGDPLFRA